MRENGRCPLDEWLTSKSVTNEDKNRLDARVDAIEGVEGELPHDWLKPYKTTTLHELKVRAKGKQLRPLCRLNGRKIEILCGAFERDGEIPRSDLDKAEALKLNLEEGNGSLVRYQQDENDVEAIF